MWKKKLCIIICLSLFLSSFIGVISKETASAEINSGPSVTIERFAGADRYTTAIDICKKNWNAKTDYAVLATGENFPDALTAAPLAKKYNAPILLTNKDTLNVSTKAELQRLNVKTVFIVGGLGAVSQSVENTLNSLNIKVKRFYGKDRYETAIKIAEEVGLNSNGVFVATGEDFPDALSVASIAAQKGMPIILVPKNNLTENIKQYVSNNNISKAYVIGDTNTISANIVSILKNTERIYGTNKYSTNTAIIEKFQLDLDFSNLCIATGENFPDALSGSALAAMGNSPIVLVKETSDESTKDLLNKKAFLLKNLRVFGGEAVVSGWLTKKILGKFTLETLPLETLPLGNIVNGGFVAEQGDWIYYNAEDGIYKVSKSNKVNKYKVVSLENNYEYPYLNADGEWLYFVMNGQVIRVKNSGTELSILKSDAKEYGSGLTLSKNRLYYLDKFENIVSIDKDGKDYKKITSDECSYINVVGDWIYYINQSDTVKYQYKDIIYGGNREVTMGKIYKIKIDGSSKIKLSTEGVGMINVYKDWIYYSNGNDGVSVGSEGDSWYEGKLYRMSINGTDKIKIVDKGISGINAVDGWIYYRNWSESGLYRISESSNINEKVLNATYCSAANVIGTDVFFIDISNMARMYDSPKFNQVYYESQSSNSGLYSVTTVSVPVEN